ncbi:MAG: pilus assembly protein TadE, partial [Chloroflexus aggregans]
GVACARDVADWQELQDLRSP